MPEIKQKQPQDRKTVFETLSLPFKDPAACRETGTNQGPPVLCSPEQDIRDICHLDI